MKKIAAHMFLHKTFIKMTISQKLIESFIFSKKELIVHTLSFRIKFIVNFCKNKSPYTRGGQHTARGQDLACQAKISRPLHAF